MTDVFDMGKVSTRGQIAIPVEIRKEMGLGDGAKVLFFLEDDTLLIKKVSTQTWEQLTKPLRQLKKKIEVGMVNDAVHRVRQSSR